MFRSLRKAWVIVAVFSVVVLFAVSACDPEREVGTMAMPDTTDNTEHTPVHHRSDELETATFAAGCFWGVEATFRQLNGVTATAVGYTGGQMDEPTYKDVCSDKTGHAEAVRVYYDPDEITYEKLLDTFFENHNPTLVNRQGPDVGTQYRSAVFYHNDGQREVAEAAKKALDESGKFTRPVVTEINPAATFYKAEEYHQQYLEKRGKTSCSIE